MNKGVSLWIGIGILIFLLVSYFIPVYWTVAYDNLVDAKMKSSLLRIIIFHNPWVLGIYIIVALVFIYYGLKNIKFKIK